MESSVMLGSIPFFIQPHFGGFLAMAMHRAIGACRCGAVFGGDGDGNQNAMATAEGRLCKTRNIILAVGCALCSKKAWLHFCSHALVMIMR